MDEDYVAIGVITAVRGLRGELKVKPLTDHPERFNELKTVVLYRENNPIQYYVHKTRFFKDYVLVQLKTVDTISDAEKLVGMELLVTKNEIVSLDHDEYFWFDLVGMKVVTVSDKTIGIITKIIDGASNDIYEVQGDQGEILIPAIRQVIKNVDVENKIMVIEPMPGLIPDDRV